MLFTIGYEGRIIDDFISVLKNNNIEKIVDVRELPLSRKRGYSKTPFSRLLEDNGIDYIHLKELGSPRKLRKKLKKDGDLDSFFEEYRKYLKTQNDTVNILYNIISREKCCLVCYEGTPQKCHRTEIVTEIKRIDGNGLKIRHL